MMTPQEAYKTLDLAKGLGMERVEPQFLKLKTEMEEKIASTSNERLKQVYSNRLMQVEEARASLIDYLHRELEGNQAQENLFSEKKLMRKSKSTLSKWLLIFLPLIFIGAYFLWQFQQLDPKVEAEKLAQKFCDCQNQNNQEYITQLNDFINTFESQEYKFAKDVKRKLDQFSSDYEARRLTVSISTCFNNFEIEKSKIQEKFPSDSNIGKEFWLAFEEKINENIDLRAQEQEISNLHGASFQKLSAMVYNNENDLKNRKNTIYNLLNDFYTSYSGGYADAYNYFAYNVEQYITLKNITPTDINLALKKTSDYIDPSFKIASETLNLIKSEYEIETWEYAAEFQCYRSSLEQYQISNVWYEIKINAIGKLISYRERKVEKTKFFSPEDFNSMNNRNDYETGW
jgi:hypothetical protein